MKTFLMLAFAAFLSLSQTAQAQMKDPEIDKAQAYLKGLSTATADFIQTSSLGSRLSGKFYLDRPGRMRFDYNEIKDFIVADGFFVYYYDSQMGEQSNAPIGQTLADFLLRDDLSLTDDLNVVKLNKKKGQIFMTLVQKDEPEAGQVELVFNEIPYQLSSWHVLDAQNQRTDVILKNFKMGMKLDNDLFGYRDPKGRKAVND